MIIHNLDPEYQGARLDRYLRKLYPLLTQGIIQKAIRKKQIKISKRVAPANTLLEIGDTISVPEHFSSYTKQPASENKADLRAQALAKKIYQNYLIFDHEGFLAINKPTGLATQGGSKIDISIDHSLQALSTEAITYKLVHRLDKDTSGILLIAKNHRNAVQLTQAFKDRIIEKLYLGVLSGIPEKFSGIIRSKEEHSGKESITSFKILATNKELNVSLCLFKPYTGRMHQLRYHATLLGYPLVGDRKYGGEFTTVRTNSLKLHAYILRLPASLYTKEIALRAKLPEGFAIFLEKHLDIKNLEEQINQAERYLPLP